MIAAFYLILVMQGSGRPPVAVPMESAAVCQRALDKVSAQYRFENSFCLEATE